MLGLAVAAKLYPLALLPIALVYLARRRGLRETAISLALFGLVLLVAFVPFALIAPDGLQASFERQTGRPLQIESLGSAALLAAAKLGSYEPKVVSSFGSQNLTGALPDALATTLTVLQVVAMVGVWLLFAMRAGLEGRVDRRLGGRAVHPRRARQGDLAAVPALARAARAARRRPARRTAPRRCWRPRSS